MATTIMLIIATTSLLIIKEINCSIKTCNIHPVIIRNKYDAIKTVKYEFLKSPVSKKIMKQGKNQKRGQQKRSCE